ncbi:MAG: UDP-N-acetylmuramoyl-L-alanine--D-glutamate ligase, partial [Deltaproteobacteria bacterium]|nr:UDP-N-acetylmuramoyl-L-alanine--D-glutamate ligase [Deltaproteobacteria bacterium]
MMMEVEEKIPMVTTFKNKNILIVGLARSGTGAANLLSELGARVSITDTKSLSALEDKIKNLSPAVRVIADCDAGEVIGSVDMIVISPGVPLHIPLLLKARMNGTPVIGELELAYNVIQSVDSLHVHCEGEGASGPASPPVIGITGTNGKSTTTTLIDRMLNASGYRTLLGGNIGNALTEELFKAISGQQSAIGDMPEAERCQLNADYIVAEVSSFQLESIEKFRPDIAAILNITPDHLDRYRDMQDYIRAKARMFENQTSVDWIIINADDPVLMELIDEKRKVKNREMPRIAYFSREKEVDGVYSRDGVIYCNLSDDVLMKRTFPSVPADSLLIGVNEMRIKGIHNLENAMAAALVAIISGCPLQTVREVLCSFPGLEHRLEFVAEIRGVRFINDSKGTNVGAVAKSMGGFDSVILIMGGMDKGSDFTLLRDLIKKKVKQLIV